MREGLGCWQGALGGCEPEGGFNIDKAGDRRQPLVSLEKHDTETAARAVETICGSESLCLMLDFAWTFVLGHSQGRNTCATENENNEHPRQLKWHLCWLFTRNKGWPGISGADVSRSPTWVCLSLLQQRRIKLFVSQLWQSTQQRQFVKGKVPVTLSSTGYILSWGRGRLRQ